MSGKYHDEVLEVIKRKGPLGVNALAKELNVPLSTLQKYLTQQQSYFKKNENRMWALPETVKDDLKSSRLTSSISAFENSLEMLRTQAQEIESTVDSLALYVNIVKRSIDEVKSPPVAENKSDIPESFVKIFDSLRQMPDIIKSHRQNITEDMLKLLLNVDWYMILREMGGIYVRETLQPDLFDLLSSNKDEMSEEVLELLKEYQIGQI